MSGKGTTGSTFANSHLLKTTNWSRMERNLCSKRQDIWGFLKLDRWSEAILTPFNIINTIEHQFQLDRMPIALPLKTVSQTKLGTGKRPIRMGFKALVITVC